MEQKINITKYMIDSVKEIEKALESCQKSIVEIKDRKSHAKAAFDWSVANKKNKDFSDFEITEVFVLE